VDAEASTPSSHRVENEIESDLTLRCAPSSVSSGQYDAGGLKTDWMNCGGSFRRIAQSLRVCTVTGCGGMSAARGCMGDAVRGTRARSSRFGVSDRVSLAPAGDGRFAVDVDAGGRPHRGRPRLRVVL